MKEEFDEFLRSWARFEGQFITWGEKKKGEMNARITKIDEEIAQLTVDLEALRQKLITAGLALGIGALATAAATVLAIATGGLAILLPVSTSYSTSRLGA